MKRLSYRQRLRISRLTRTRTFEHQRRKAIRKERLRVLDSPAFAAQSKLTRIALVAPRRFSLYHLRSRRRVLRFLDRLRQCAAAGMRVRIDFGDVSSLEPCGTLLLVAEISRLLGSPQLRARISCSYPRNHVVEQLFQHIGLLERLGCSPRKVIEHRAVKHWTYHTGTIVDMTGMAELKRRLEQELGDLLAFDLCSGIQEAVTNAVHHAYIEPRGDGIEVKDEGWWLFAQHVDGEVHIAICDVGVGIRRSLPRSGVWPVRVIEAVLRSLGASADLDAKYIKAALELGETRTGEDNRGKGLPEMLQLVRNARYGSLRIHSNKGMLSYFGAQGVEKILDYPDSMMGTLIQWTFDAKKLVPAQATENV